MISDWRAAFRRFRRRARSHLTTLRSQPLRRTLARDRARLRNFLRSKWWGLAHGSAGPAVPVYIIGLQRSGTNMLVEALQASPEVEVYNESRDSTAFRGFRLGKDAIVAELIRTSRHRCVVFKPLADSHRIVHLLDELDTARPGRAVWVVRSMEGRVRSVLARWPDRDLKALRDIAAGSRRRWQAGGLSDQTLDLVRSFDYETMTPESAAALLWYLRNSLYFDLGLDARSDVALVSYEQLVAEPERNIRRLCDFLGISYDNRSSSHIAPRLPATTARLEIDAAIQRRCSELDARFAAELEKRDVVPLVPSPL